MQTGELATVVVVLLGTHGLPLWLLWRRATSEGGYRPWRAVPPVFVFGWIAWLLWRVNQGSRL